jgi:aldehyde dehydrogenase (NAD+)
MVETQVSPTLIIKGSRVEGEGTEFQSLNPASGSVFATFRGASEAQVDEALLAASIAKDGAWARFTGKQRAALLHRVADLIELNKERLAQIVTDEVGTPISQSVALQVQGPINTLRWYAEMAERGPRGGYEVGLAPTADGLTTCGFLRYEPVGVVAALTPYNFPYNMLAWKLGGALAAGCACILLPSPRATASTYALFELLLELDLPEGVVSLLLGGPEVGERMVSSALVNMVTFTGSDAVGRKILHNAADGLKKVVLELGGKNPSIILPGANLESLIAPTALRFASNAGQKCGSTTRLIVHEDDVSAFTKLLVEQVRSLPVVDPREPETVVGPLIADEHRHFVESQIAAAARRGAQIEAGGDRPAGTSGFYLNPTVLSGLPSSDPMNHIELFAPVAAIQSYETIDEAVAIANDSDYGLNATVYGDFVTALDVARRVRAGTVAINGGGGQRPDAPWGGYGYSGLGRELGDDGFAEFFEVKHVQWSMA